MNRQVDKLKFLFVSADKYPPFRVDVAVLFGRELAGRGHEIDWILQSDEDCRESHSISWVGGRVWVGRTDNGRSRLARVRKHVFGILHDCKLFGLIRDEHYDFVQVKDKFISASFAIAAARLYRVRLIYWLSFPFPEASFYKYKDGTARYPLFYLLRGWFLKLVLYKFIMPLADHVFVQSEQMKRDVVAMGVDEAKLTAVPMGVCLQDFSSPDERQDEQHDPQALVYIGTLARVRRPDFLIGVMSRVLRELANVRLYLVGDGEEPADRDAIVRRAAELGIEAHVEITGFLPREKALEYVREADVCLSPFYPTPILNSTSPTKLVEYMAMRKPVVANDHPEQKLVLAESGGGLCVPYSEERFAAAVIELLRDPERAKHMGTKGRQYVEQHRSYSRLADMVERQYGLICEKRIGCLAKV